MKVHQLHTTQVLPITLETAWDFFSSPANLPVITPPWLDFQMTNTVPERMQPGTIITYRIRPVLGLPIRWTTEITHLEAPHYFVDEQRFGPYKLWHHQHFFREVDGGVACEDLVHYGLGFGPAGALAHRLMVRDKLEAIFAFRRQALAERFG